MNDAQRNLLQSLADALRDLDEEAGFNMDIWASKKLPESKDLHCGTSCCAIGLASTLPDWQKAGLTLRKRDLNWSTVYEPIFDGKRNFDAVAALLGISRLEAGALFDPDLYSDPEDIRPWEVAYRIERYFLREDQA